MTDREHFEAWLRRRFPRGEIHVSNGEYEHQTTQHQYEAFVAGMAVKQAEVEALRKENAELKLLFPQTSPHGTKALGIIHRSPLMEFGMRNRQMGIEEGRRQRDAEVEALRAFHSFFMDRIETLFSAFGMPAVDLFNAAATSGEKYAG